MRRLWLIFSQAATVALAVLFVVGTLKPQWLLREGRPLTDVVSLRTAPEPSATAVASPPGAAAGFTGYHAAARAAAPAVVSVTASKSGRRNPHAQDPTFRFFFH